jgi:hypothetical protein
MSLTKPVPISQPSQVATSFASGRPDELSRLVAEAAHRMIEIAAA